MNMDGGAYPDHIMEQMNSHKQLINQFYHNDKHATSVNGKQGKSSLEMLRLSCEQLQAKTPHAMRTAPEQKTVETITSAYDKMSEIDAFNILKKKILKDTTHCHLWMFLFDILLDSNKSNVATWEDQKGMFRIRDPTRLAEMWGEKRNRTNMTYEKLSRSLRHYYEKKILRKVPKRKYTYKFNSREILKSYEVQPFYRRSTSNSQAQRNAAAAAAAQQQAASQAQLATVYQTSPTSGQCSPYTPGVTPSPSYHQHHAGFNWNQMPAFPQAWPIAVENPHQSHYQVPTSMAGKQWHLPMQQVYHQSVDQGLIHSPVTQPLAPQYHHMSSAVMPTSQTYQGAESRAAQYMTDMQTAGSPASVPADEKPNLDLIIDNFSSSKTKRSHSLPAITPPSPTFAASNALFNQNNSNSNSNQNRCRPNSVNSYESSSPDSIYSNDAMFNDIMESLVMEAF